MGQAESLLTRCLKWVRDNTKSTERPASNRIYGKYQDGDVA